MAVLEGTAYWAFVTSPNTKYDPCYTVNLVVDESTAQNFEDRGFPVKQMEEGPAIIIQYKEWESQWNGRTYKGLDFMKMQVIKLVEYNDPNADEFEIEDEEEAEL